MKYVDAAISEKIFEDLSWKGKVDSPDKTIYKAREILHKLGLVCKEHWMNPVNNYYSVSLRIVGTNYLVNGKGSSVLATLASSYAELMERLQNCANFNLEDFEVINTNNFKICPDELKITDCCELENFSWVKSYNFNKSMLQLLVDELKKSENSSYITALPFTKINSSTIEYIPYNLLREYYLTNGMSAGNTYDEAIAQGICEVIERHIHKLLLRDSSKLVLIPYEKMNSLNKKLYDSINNIPDLTIKLYDAFENYGFPVVVALVANTDKTKYFMRLGCSSNLDIAIERTLTEVMQGKSMSKLTWLSDVVERDLTNHEIEMHFVSGISPMPSHILSISDTFSSLDNWSSDLIDTQHCLESLKLFLARNNLDPLVRKIGWLGFPACHVIIPGISEILSNPIESIKQYNNAQVKASLLRRIGELSNVDLKNLYELLSTDNRDYITACMLQFTKNNLYSKYTMPQIKFMICIKLKNLNDAMIHLNEMQKQLQKDSPDYQYLNYIKIQLEDGVIEDINLGNSINSADDIFSFFQPFKCNDHGACFECANYDSCYTARKRELLKKLISNMESSAFWS